MRPMCILLSTVLLALVSAASLAQGQLTRDQRLVVAAFKLDVAKVKALLAEGAHPDARLGFYDEHLFRDNRLLGYSPIGSGNWTPLLATLHSHREPPPATRTVNTPAALEKARLEIARIDPRLVLDRDERRIEIARRLIAAGASLDLDDGHGQTALAAATPGYEAIALLLIEKGAEINTQIGIYIDGPYGDSPVHEAISSPKILSAMLKQHPRLDVQNSLGKTPLHWAVQQRKLESVRLLLDAGADPTITDGNGKTAAAYCETYRGDPNRAIKEEMAKLLPSVDSHVQPSPNKYTADDLALDSKNLIGTWTVVSVSKNGRDATKGNPAEFVFLKAQLVIKWPTKIVDCNYELGARQNLKTLQITQKINATHTTEGNGLYELDGDTLTLALGPPDAFLTQLNDKNQELFVLNRKR